jgi:Zn-dependent protease
MNAREGFKLVDVFGIELRVDWSLSFLLLLVVIDLAAGVFPTWHPGWSLALDWGLALATALLFVVSIACHELCHALAARAQRVPVRRITLFVFGGMTEFASQFESPRVEVLSALAGPAFSIVAGVAATSASWSLIGGQPVDAAAMQAMLRVASPLATLLFWIGSVNLMLGLFNLLPGFPLDGGRVLRAALWALFHDRQKATRWASMGGRVVGAGLMALGVINLLGNLFGQGIWLLLIGWFLSSAARATQARSLLRDTLEHVPVSRLMRTDLARLPPNLPVQALVDCYLLRGDQQIFPVEQDGRLLGVISRESVRALPSSSWGTSLVSSIMTSLSDAGPLPLDASASQAFDRLVSGSSVEVPVLDHGQFVGIVERADLIRWIGLHPHGAT